MKKPDSLRAALVATIPELANDPQQLIMWIDQGAIASPCTPSFNFAYSYRLNALLIDYTGHQALLAIAMLPWLRRHQPDLLQPGKDAISFEADYLDSGTVDLQFALQLREQVIVTPREDGGFDMVFQDEPDPLFADDLPIGEADGFPPLTSLWLGGERIIPGPA